MALESKVRERFLEGSCSILSEDELKSWWEDDNMSVLHECLQTMVNNGYLGSRPVSAGSTETTIYWLEMKDQPIVATPGSVRPISGSLRQRLKRSRPSFVSPLLSNSSSDESGGKRPKLNSTPSNLERSQTVPCGDASPCMTSGSIVRGKLDFTSLTSTSATSVTDMSEQTANRDAVSTGAAVYKTDCVIDNKYTVSGVQLKTLLGEKDSLQIQLTEKKEELRKLRMVKTYRTKNELQGLDQLIIKWRDVAQEVAETLLENSTSEPRPSMEQLLDYLHIDCTLIHYSTEDESFY